MPHLDKIVFEVGQEPVVALLRLQRGEVDIAGDGIPPAKFLEVTQDPAYKDLIIQGSQLHTGYVTMNVKAKPFDDVRVRQAVNMAINKDRIVRIINGRAMPANQPLPPSMPGYATDYKGYAYDVEGAKKLLAEAGHGGRLRHRALRRQHRPAAAHRPGDPAGSGRRSASRPRSRRWPRPTSSPPAATRTQSPMIWSGGMAWIADFPDPSNFYGPILGCGGAVQGGWNWSWYCNEDLDKRAAEADAIVDPAKAAEREAKWRDIFLDVMKDAPWAPVFNEQRYTIRSSGWAATTPLFVDPVHIPVNYDNVYATDAQ